MIAAGGTGGHLYPAIAAAREIASLAPEVAVHFAGSERGPEARLVPQEGFPFTPVASGPWRRGHPLSGAKALALMARGALQARRLLKAVNAGVVFSTGGFTGAPVLLAAATCGIPTVLLEPNVRPGLVTRAFGRLAARVTVGSKETLRYFSPARTKVTGVPVRRELLNCDPASARRALGLDASTCVVLVLGGSQGASAINRAVAEALPHVTSSHVPLAFVWVCGNREHNMYEPVARNASLPVKLFGYVDDMGGPLGAADLVVARAGASTVAELLALGKPSVLVPYPHAAADHQTQNALALAREGAAILLPEAQLNGQRLAEVIRDLAADPSRRVEMARCAEALGAPAAARAVAEEIVAVMRARSSKPPSSPHHV